MSASPPEGERPVVNANVAGFLLGLAFLTRLPVPRSIHLSGAPLRIGPATLLGAGLLLGALLALFSWTLRRFFPVVPLPLETLILLGGWILLTGGIHLDGVADTLECAYAPVSPEEKRRIRKDPRKGVFGILGLILYVLAKGTGIFLAHPRLWALFLAPVLSRAFLPAISRILAGRFPGAEGGLGTTLLEGSGVSSMVLLLLGALGVFLTGEERIFWAAGAAFLGMFALGRLYLPKVDGFSGDVAGFLVESGEILFLLALSLSTALDAHSGGF
ncbi:MAG: adenosylcobinamide-GDP ribazoletransferase [Leptospirillia bacterium]